jgi:hypothetical protein
MTDISANTDTRRFLRHTLATLAYRCGKAVRGDIKGADIYRASETTRTPLEILAHVGDLLDWGLNLARGNRVWTDHQPMPWDQEVERFHRAIAAFDAYLASDEPLHEQAEKLFQGPIADALHHTGQINLLRRMAGAPVRAENYFLADVREGSVGPDQAEPRFEFE